MKKDTVLEAIKELTKRVEEHSKEIENLKRIVERISRDVEHLKLKLGAKLEVEVVGKARKIPKILLVELSLLCSKDEHSLREELERFSKKYGVPISSRYISYCKSLLVKKGILEVKNGWEVKDWWLLLRDILSRGVEARKVLIDVLSKRYDIAYRVVEGLIVTYGKKAFHINDDFAKDCINLDKEFYVKIVDKVLDRVVLDLKAKGIIETVKGLNARLIAGVPVAVIVVKR